jgi:hypothetical protein
LRAAPGRASGISLLHDFKIDHRKARTACGKLVVSISLEKNDVGGARRDRTDDLKLAKLALSQLSYGPICVLWPSLAHPDIQHHC